MSISNLKTKRTDNLAEIIATNFDSSFLIPLSIHYSAEEWNAAMHQALAVRSRKTCSDTL